MFIYETVRNSSDPAGIKACISTVFPHAELYSIDLRQNRLKAHRVYLCIKREASPRASFVVGVNAWFSALMDLKYTFIPVLSTPLPSVSSID